MYPLYLETFASGIRLKSSHTTNQKWFRLPKRQSTWQQHTQTHCICKQKPIKYRQKIQQHWKRGTKHTTWAWEVPSLLLCKRGEYNNRSQTACSKLSQRIQWFIHRIHQYRVRIIHKHGPDLFIADWLLKQNQKETKDEEIPGMQLNFDAIWTTINIWHCTMIQKLQGTSQDDHLKQLKDCIIRG